MKKHLYSFGLYYLKRLFSKNFDAFDTQYLQQQRSGLNQAGELVRKYPPPVLRRLQCGIFTKKAQKAAKKAAQEYAIRLFENGVSFEVVLSSITQLTKKELEQIYQKAAAL